MKHSLIFDLHGNLTKESCRIVRSVAGVRSNMNINVIKESAKAPTREGHPGYWTTPSGKTIVFNPKYYGWRTLYNHSTERVEVGENWTFNIPSGMKLETNGGLHLIRLSDGMDLHFCGKQLLQRDFCQWARKEMAVNYYKRIKSRQMEKQFKFISKGTNVTFEDARHTGSCVQGILNFAWKLKIDRDLILQAPWCIQVPAEIAMRIASKYEKDRVKSAIWQAYVRETMVCI